MKTVIGVVLMVATAVAHAGGNEQTGEKRITAEERVKTTCSACHGPAGAKPISPDIPILAGQPQDYLMHALHEYKSGARKNPMMSPQAQSLLDQDIADVAAFLSKQPSSLTTAR